MIDKIKNFFFWGWKLRANFDWDGGFVYSLLYIKLDRMYEYAKADEICQWTDEGKNQMRKLLEAKGLCKQLMEDNFNKNISSFNAKYRRDTDTGIGELFKDLYPNAKKIDEKQHVSLFTIAVEKDQKEFNTVNNRFWYLMSKYTRHWWI